MAGRIGAAGRVFGATIPSGLTKQVACLPRSVTGCGAGLPVVSSTWRPPCAPGRWKSNSTAVATPSNKAATWPQNNTATPGTDIAVGAVYGDIIERLQADKISVLEFTSLLSAAQREATPAEVLSAAVRLLLGPAGIDQLDLAALSAVLHAYTHIDRTVRRENAHVVRVTDTLTVERRRLLHAVCLRTESILKSLPASQSLSHDASHALVSIVSGLARADVCTSSLFGLSLPFILDHLKGLQPTKHSVHVLASAGAALIRHRPDMGAEEREVYGRAVDTVLKARMQELRSAESSSSITVDQIRWFLQPAIGCLHYLALASQWSSASDRHRLRHGVLYINQCLGMAKRLHAAEEKKAAEQAEQDRRKQQSTGQKQRNRAMKGQRLTSPPPPPSSSSAAAGTPEGGGIKTLRLNTSDIGRLAALHLGLQAAQLRLDREASRPAAIDASAAVGAASPPAATGHDASDASTAAVDVAPSEHAIADSPVAEADAAETSNVDATASPGSAQQSIRSRNSKTRPHPRLPALERPIQHAIRGWQEHNLSRLNPSALQLEVRRALVTVCGRTHMPAPVSEHVTAQGLIIDFAWPLPQRLIDGNAVSGHGDVPIGVALEVDGPQHFVANLDSTTGQQMSDTQTTVSSVAAPGSRAADPLPSDNAVIIDASTLYKYWLLESFGWQVVHVPYLEWQALPRSSPGAREQYLIERLRSTPLAALIG